MTGDCGICHGLGCWHCGAEWTGSSYKPRAKNIELTRLPTQSEMAELVALRARNAELLTVVQDLESAVLSAHNLIEADSFTAAELTIRRANKSIWKRRSNAQGVQHG